jgi:hypothetical protein
MEKRHFPLPLFSCQAVSLQIDRDFVEGREKCFAWTAHSKVFETMIRSLPMIGDLITSFKSL